jgi:hypothetical protein
VIAGDHDYTRSREPGAQSQELPEGMQNRCVGRTRGVEHVPGDEHEVRRERDDLVDRALERARYICLALIDARRGEALVLPETEVDVREVDDTHALSANLAVDARQRPSHGSLRTLDARMTRIQRIYADNMGERHQTRRPIIPIREDPLNPRDSRVQRSKKLSPAR